MMDAAPADVETAPLRPWMAFTGVSLMLLEKEELRVLAYVREVVVGAAL